MIAAQIARALAGGGVKPKGGNFLVCCPAHEDDNPITVAARR